MNLHWGEILSGIGGGAFLWGALGHAVQTFPTPKNVYGQWALGLAQWMVGQRERAANTFAGGDTATVELQRGHQ